MDTAIQQAQKKIEYISNDAESYRQILLREQALLDYQSDLNAYRREGIQVGEKAEREKWQDVVAEKDAEIARLREQLEKKT